MECCSACCALLVLAVILTYKLLDRLIRIPRISDYQGRFILVTGCDTGFGERLARRLDSLGCHVFAGCLTEAGEVSLRKACSPRLVPVPLDVARPESVRRAHEIVKNKLPPGKGLWGIMNNAGVGGRGGPIEWMTLDDYRQCADVNLYGLIDVTATFLPLVKLVRGRVVNTASILGRYAYAAAVPYTISKFGVEAYTDSLRRQMLPFGVKALLIEPGFFKTNITAPSTVNVMLERTWAQLSPDLQREYGEDYLREAIEMYSRNNENASDRPEDVVAAYEHALLARYPRARYVVGADAKLLWLPLQWMPEWLGDRLLTLLFRPPLPAALRQRR